jgi:hypothetical protein
MPSTIELKLLTILSSADDAVAGERRPQFSGVGIALRPFAAFADDVVHVAMPVLYSGDEAPPMAIAIAGEQARVIALVIVEVADHVHRPRMRRPHAKRRAVANQIGAHRRVGIDVIEGGPGEPDLYTIHLPEGRAVQTHVEPGEAGRNEVHYTFFTEEGSELPIAGARGEAIPEDGEPRTLEVRRLSPGHIVNHH